MSDLHFLRGMVNSAYDMQRLRIATGSRLAANFHSKLGIKPGEKKDKTKIDKENAKVLKQIEKDFNRLHDGIAALNINVLKERRRILTAQQLNKTQVNKVLKYGADEGNLISESAEWDMTVMYFNMLDQEKDAFKRVGSFLENFDIWNKYLVNVPGIGPALGGIIVAYLDPHKARYIGSFYRYIGVDTEMDPETNKIYGRRNFGFHLGDFEYVDRDGNTQTKRGLTYNPFVKSKFLGVMPEVFHKRNKYYNKIYHDYKNRLLSQSWRFTEDMVVPKMKNGKPVLEKGKPVMVPEWPDARITKMSDRYMIKMFIKNLWVTWRFIEGLPIIAGYEEFKLGMDTSHHIDPWGLVQLPQLIKSM